MSTHDATMGNGQPCRVEVLSDLARNEVVLVVTPLNDLGVPVRHPRAVVRLEVPHNAFLAEAILRQGQGMQERRQHAARLAQINRGTGRA